MVPGIRVAGRPQAAPEEVLWRSNYISAPCGVGEGSKLGKVHCGIRVTSESRAVGKLAEQIYGDRFYGSSYNLQVNPTFLELPLLAWKLLECSNRGSKM